MKEEPDLEEEIIYTAEYGENMFEVIPDRLSESHETIEQDSLTNIILEKSLETKKGSVQKSINNRTYYSKTNKDENYTLIVNGVKNYPCEICEKIFSSRSRLKTHQMTHSIARNFRCEECGANFKTANCLKNHSRLHLNIFFYCDLCSRKFKGKHELRCHIDAVHLKKKDHVCQLCGKAFSRDKTLRQHLLYHTNERKIVCEICGFKTINQPKMTRHLKSHSGQRDYACNICKFKNLFKLNNKLKTLFLKSL